MHNHECQLNVSARGAELQSQIQSLETERLNATWEQQLIQSLEFERLNATSQQQLMFHSQEVERLNATWQQQLITRYKIIIIRENILLKPTPYYYIIDHLNMVYKTKA